MVCFSVTYKNIVLSLLCWLVYNAVSDEVIMYIFYSKRHKMDLNGEYTCHGLTGNGTCLLIVDMHHSRLFGE